MRLDINRDDRTGWLGLLLVYDFKVPPGGFDPNLLLLDVVSAVAVRAHGPVESSVWARREIHTMIISAQLSSISQPPLPVSPQIVLEAPFFVHDVVGNRSVLNANCSALICSHAGSDLVSSVGSSCATHPSYLLR